MNIQDLIARLAAIKEEHGNLPVVMYDDSLGGGRYSGPRKPHVFIRDIDEKPVCIEITQGVKYENDPY
jgi:hypothetical protein